VLVGVGAGKGVGVGAGAGVAVGVGTGVLVGVGAGLGVAVGVGLGLGVAVANGFGVGGRGVGGETLPPFPPVPPVLFGVEVGVTLPGVPVPGCGEGVVDAPGKICIDEPRELSAG